MEKRKKIKELNKEEKQKVKIKKFKEKEKQKAVRPIFTTLSWYFLVF